MTSSDDGNIPTPAAVSKSGVTLVVLAGGRGERMGRPKGELTVGGVPILTHLLARLDWPGPTLLVTAPGRERPPGHDGFDAEAVDPVEGQGPLRGVLTAMDFAGPVVVVVTVDMPGIGPTQLDWLLGQLRPGDPAVMSDRDGRREPFPLLIRSAAADVVRDRLATGRRSVHGLADVPGVRVVSAPADWPATVWANLNTPADHATFETTGWSERA